MLPGVLLALVLAGMAWLYAPVLGFEFVMFDDDINLYGNPHIGELTWARFVWAWTAQDYLPRVMPVAWLIVMTIFGAAGMDPAAFHAYNLALHLANTAIVFAVARQALRLAAQAEGRLEDCWAGWLAVLAAAGWGMHPARSESVAWATGWVYTSASFFALGSAWFMLGRLELNGLARRWRGAVAIVFYMAAALVYPLALGFPAAVLAFEWWLGRVRRTRGSLVDGKRREALCLHASLFAVSLIVLAWNVWARVEKNRTYPPSPDLAAFTIENRVSQALTTMPYYAARQAWAGDSTPVWETRAPEKMSEPRVMLWTAVVIVWVGWALLRLRNASGWFAAGFAFAGAAAPFSGLMDYPFLANDRYGYLPGAVLMVSLALALRTVDVGRMRLWVLAGLGLWVSWLAMAVPSQLPKWSDSEALLGHIRASLAPGEGRTLYGEMLARHRARRGDFEASRALLDELEREAGRAAVAAMRSEVDRLERIAGAPTAIPTPLGLVPADAALPYRMARRDAEAGENTGAYHRYRQALANDPDYHDARYNFAIWLALTGRVQEAEAQAEELRRRVGGFLPPELDRPLASVIAQARKRDGGGE